MRKDTVRYGSTNAFAACSRCKCTSPWTRASRPRRSARRTPQRRSLDLARCTLGQPATPNMSVSTPALVVLAMWWACETAFRPAARRRFGHELTDGYPRWRVALGCLTQIVSFPVMFLAFVLGRQPWLMESFLLVFACCLLQDCVRFPKTIVAKRCFATAACLVGLLVARFGAGPDWRSVFPYFHCGCTALELGSGACNVPLLCRKHCGPQTSAS